MFRQHNTGVPKLHFTARLFSASGGMNSRIIKSIVWCSSLGILAACATNPVTGRRELSLVSESQEISMGQEGAKQVEASIGLVQDQALQSYVQNVGKRLAAK